MAKITGKYEVLYIINPTLGEESIAALVTVIMFFTQFKTILDRGPAK